MGKSQSVPESSRQAVGQAAAAAAAPAPSTAADSGSNGKAPAAGTTAQGAVQRVFDGKADWEAVFERLAQDPVIQEHYGSLLEGMSPAEQKILQVRTLVPFARASLARKPEALVAKRTGNLNMFRDMAEKKGFSWRGNAAALETRGEAIWEAERKAVHTGLQMPAYYKACYDGPIHSYGKGNGEWMAAFDAPSAYLVVHMHHFPAMAPQAAFDALHEEFDNLALRHLTANRDRPIRCIDIGCGVGTSTFSTVRSLEKAGRTGTVTGLDLSDYFITVANHIQKERQGEFTGAVSVEFKHGDGLDLRQSGFEDESADLVVVSEVTHEMPRAKSEELFVEAARALVPGGVLGYLDLNPSQILKDNVVGNLVDRVATCNEPYFDEYLELDVARAMEAAGLEVKEVTWPNHERYATAESCSLRILVAKKPERVSRPAAWTGRWALERRENFEALLTFLGTAEAPIAPESQHYEVEEDTFFLEESASPQPLRFSSFIDGEWCASPYKVKTEKADDDGVRQWKHEWLQCPAVLQSTMLDFAGTGATATLRRELVSAESLKYTWTVTNTDTSETLVGPCVAWYKRTSTEPPASLVSELREIFKSGVTRSLEWRLAALDKAAAIVLENVEALSAAQAADHVSPSNMMGASMMVKGAIGYYKAMLPSWMASAKPAETLPPFMQTKGEWEVVPEPKGVGLVIAPWNAPVLLCVLPLMGMLAAGNTCVLKPSEAAPKSSRLVARLVQKYFPDRSVVVAEGGREVVERLIAAPVDHVLFTGGTVVGKKIMELASKHLTPVSLELGGKNPCYIDVADQALLDTYVAEIVGTKSYFGGQFCQAQDYCLVNEKVFDQFVRTVESKIQALGERRSCQMIHAKHAQRVRSLLEAHSGQVRPPLVGTWGADAADHVPLTMVVNPDVRSPIMSEEIFGPLLPVIKVRDVQEAVDFVRSRPKPLVCYCYSSDVGAWDQFRDLTSSGNLAINCGPQRMQSNFNVGFGGVGDSGFGHSIWGKAAFDDYSHKKTVFRGEQFAGSVWGASPPPGPKP